MKTHCSQRCPKVDNDTEQTEIQTEVTEVLGSCLSTAMSHL